MNTARLERNGHGGGAVIFDYNQWVIQQYLESWEQVGSDQSLEVPVESHRVRRRVGAVAVDGSRTSRYPRSEDEVDNAIPRSRNRRIGGRLGILLPATGLALYVFAGSALHVRNSEDGAQLAAAPEAKLSPGTSSAAPNGASQAPETTPTLSVFGGENTSGNNVLSALFCNIAGLESKSGISLEGLSDDEVKAVMEQQGIKMMDPTMYPTFWNMAMDSGEVAATDIMPGLEYAADYYSGVNEWRGRQAYMVRSGETSYPAVEIDGKVYSDLPTVTRELQRDFWRYVDANVTDRPGQVA